jgi:hypothetical protein
VAAAVAAGEGRISPTRPSTSGKRLLQQASGAASAAAAAPAAAAVNLLPAEEDGGQRVNTKQEAALLGLSFKSILFAAPGKLRRASFLQRRAMVAAGSAVGGGGVAASRAVGVALQLPPGMASAARSEAAAEVRATAAFSRSDRTRKVGYLQYSPYNSTWGGVPARRHFGVGAEELPGATLPQYSAPIPLVLLALSAALREEGGLATPGIFRHPRDQRACQTYEHELALAKAALQDGSFGRRRWPVQVVAGCIKLFYRTLPKRLLKHLPRELLQDGRVLASSRFANAAVDGMPDPHRSLLQVRARADRCGLLHGRPSAALLSALPPPPPAPTNRTHARIAPTHTPTAPFHVRRAVAARAHGHRRAPPARARGGEF